MHRVALRDLEHWDIARPPVQRLLDERRVHDIVHFQRDIHHRTGSMWFPGCITLLPTSESKYLLVDGQHRFEAMRTLVPLQPDYAVCVDVVPAHISARMGVEQVFRVINMAVPVPDYVIDTIGHAHRRQLADTVHRHLTQAFGTFDTHASSPRPPNLRLDALASAVCDPRTLTALGHAVPRILDLVEWVNQQLAALPHPKLESAKLKAAKAHGKLCALGLHPGWGDPDTWHDWCVAHYLPRDPIHPPPSRPAARVPRRLKQQAWDSVFPGRRVGACQVCRRALDMAEHEAGHVVPASKGGATTLANLVPLCAPCNKSMGGRDMRLYCQAHGYAPHTPFDELLARSSRP
jgi:hypothetical protein